MKIYILTCVNENGDIVSVQPFKARELAFANMATQYYAERKEFERDGTLDGHDDIDEDSAVVGNDRYYYFWRIFEREL